MALKNNKLDKSWLFLEHFDKLRPHYFWPLLLNAGKEHGEIGIIKTVGKMLDMKVDMDNETLQLFVLPFCDISSPQMFLSRVQHLNLSMRQLLAPLLIVLLKNGRISDASQLCDNFKTSIDGNTLVYSLARAWKHSKNTYCTLKILKSICQVEKLINANVPGHLLANMLKISNNEKDYNEFLKFLQILETEKLTITASAHENIKNILGGKESCNIKMDIEYVLDRLLNMSVHSVQSYITHPRNMTIDELECHLVELMNKNMETRGTLRRLIQSHAKTGNYKRVQELRNLFEQSGYIESPGIKSSLLQTYITMKQSDLAMKIYREIRKKHSDFTIDENKLIDLATLFVEENKFEIARELLKEGCRNRKVHGGQQIERNCFNLLNSAKTSDDAVTLFRILRDSGFCEAKNTLLGPIVRSYIKSNDLDSAVTCYENCCKKYRCTPLQVELLQIVVGAKNEELLKRVLNATATVYGQKRAQMSFIVALAEKGMKKPLLKLLLDIGDVPDSYLQNRCNKWIIDRKCEPLLVLAEVCYKLKSKTLNLDIIHMAIIQIFDYRNDSEGALSFMEKLKDEEILVSQEVTNTFNNLIKRSQPSLIDTKSRR